LYVISLGNVNSDFLPYRQLVEQLGRDQPVYGLQSPGMDGRSLPLGSVEELGAHYVRELRMHQPNGPYLLLGLTFAGVVAYEIARQLEAEGDAATLVATINAAPRVFGRPRPTAVPKRPTRREWVMTKAEHLNHKLGIAYYEALVRHGRRRPKRSPWDLHFIASSRARKLYVAPPSGVRIDMFGTPQDADLAQHWEPLAGGGVAYHAVVGGGADRWRLEFLTRPHVDAMAQELGRVIERRMAERHVT
jgi:aspartate racemase